LRLLVEVATLAGHHIKPTLVETFVGKWRGDPP
jgi:hypothetical protein